MRPTLVVKVVHSGIFWLLTACVLFALYSGLVGPVTVWSWGALAVVLVEGLILMAYGWQCPLTLWAEKLGAESGSVADLFLPEVLADRLFSICGVAYAAAVLAVVLRWWLGG